jgi:hypothetical protein
MPGMSTITLLSHRQYSVLSTARILTFFEPKDANTGPLSQANALANPTFQEANTQNAPKELVHDQNTRRSKAISPRR